MKKSYTIFADYHQFYLWDKGVNPDAPTDYSDADIANRIKTAPNVVVIQPERNMDVPVDLELRDGAPESDLGAWDHVAEASLDIPTGRLEIHECTGGSIDILTVRPGSYRVRAYFGRSAPRAKMAWTAATTTALSFGQPRSRRSKC